LTGAAVTPIDRVEAAAQALREALNPMAPVKKGDSVEADFGAFGPVACRFG
jgi:hypothetical protein